MHCRSRNFFFLLSFFSVVFFAPSPLLAQIPRELPCKTVEEADRLLNEKRAQTAALRAELERRRAEAEAAAAAAEAPVDHTDQTVGLRISRNGKAVIGSGTVIGCSPSESNPKKYACFIFSAAHFFEARNGGENPKDTTPIDPGNFTIEGRALFEDGNPTVRSSVKIIAYDPKNDVSIGLMYVDAPLPAAPLPPRGYVPPLSTPVVSVGCSSSDNVPRPYGDSSTCVIEIENDSVIRTNHPPRPGDSGGGIYDESGCVIGACSSFSELKDGTPLNIGNYALAEHAYRLVDGLKREGSGYKNIGFEDGYLKVIPTLPRKTNR